MDKSKAGSFNCVSGTGIVSPYNWVMLWIVHWLRDQDPSTNKSQDHRQGLMGQGHNIYSRKKRKKKDTAHPKYMFQVHPRS